MSAIFEVLLVLMIVVSLLRKRVNLGNAMLIGAGFLFIMRSPNWDTLAATGRSLLFTSSTWEILLALYLVMCLEYQLRTSGTIDGLMAVSRVLLKSDQVLLALMPAFLGFLPSLGGAIFSAPLVEAAGKPYGLSPERKVEINYWFRHVWECTNPIIPALLVASQIAGIAIGALIANMLWVTVLCLLIGWFFYIAPLKRHAANRAATEVMPQQATGYRYLVLSVGPIVANLLLVVGMQMGPALSMFLVVITMTLVLRLQWQGIITMLNQAFDYKLFWGVTNILFFQYMLTQTGVIGEVATVLQNSGIPMVFVISAVGFMAGVLTGTTQGAVAISFPLVAAVASGDVATAATAYIACFAGQMLSPAHLCLLVTVDYFKADFLKSLRSITVFALFLLLVLAIKTKLQFIG